MELIAASGLFDPAYYLEHNPGVAAWGGDPLRHFCRYGWRQLRRPNPGFDVWWYWSNHLDPAQEAINPLLHYILVGHAAGYLPQPPAYSPGPGHVLAPGADVRRICLLAGHDPDGTVDDCVVELARELGRFSDVYYLADCIMRDGQLAKLDAYVAGRWAYRHGTYDFGSWSALATRHVGWNTIDQYDELLLVNDSNYLVGALAPVFAKMQAKACDWWGLQATKGMFPTRNRAANQFEQPIPMRHVRASLVDGYLEDCVYDFHVGSYFAAFRQPVIRDAGFRRRLAAVCAQKSKAQVVRKYEIGLTQYLIGRQFSFDTFIDDLHPLHPIFTNRQFDLIEQGFPLFKRLLLVSNHYDEPGLAGWKDKLLAIAPEAPVEMMERNLQRVADHEKLHRSFAIVEGATGVSLPPPLLAGDDFAEADLETPKFCRWWAFVVDPVTGTLAGDERAVFEAIREDASIKKIVLTRWRKLELDGEDVMVVPLRSPEGQYHLLRAGRVFAGNDPGRMLSLPLSPALHCLVNPGLETPSGSKDGMPVMGSAFGTVSSCSRHARDLPRADIVLCEHDRLPGDLRAQSDHLRLLCADRRLVLLASTPSAGLDARRGRFRTEEVAALHGWLRERGLVLGIREHGTGGPYTWYDALRGADILDLSERRFPQIEVIFRQAVALVADTPECLAGFVSTGRPWLWFGRNGVQSPSNGAPNTDNHDDARTSNACRDLPQLIAKLDAAIGAGVPDAGLVSRSRNTRGRNMEHARAMVEKILRMPCPGHLGAACTH